jgi:hypothetical protein
MYTSKYGTSDPFCEGKCSSGHYCLEASPSPTQFVCGNASVFCPAGSWAPTPTTSGFYCIHTGPKAGALDILDPEGAKCSAEIPCPPGYYCIDGIKSPCPPGTFGWRYGLSSSDCSGQVIFCWDRFLVYHNTERLYIPFSVPRDTTARRC